MDLGEALAKFTARGPIDSKARLSVTLANLTTVLQASDADVVSLLDALLQGNGLLEALVGPLRVDLLITPMPKPRPKQELKPLFSVSSMPKEV
ncbi:hypothetical protein FRC05_004608 [Tulasnella sp. 425]|nr:hypothetical protein FRC05_004608 [Tulasnella sp. 425]